MPEYKRGKISFQTERLIRDVFIPQDSAAAEKLADIESHEYPEREAFYNNDYFDDRRMYRRRKSENEIREKVVENRPIKDDVVYIPDDKDPSVLRRAKVVRDDDRNL